jgi:hypothetical protein
MHASLRNTGTRSTTYHFQRQGLQRAVKRSCCLFFTGGISTTSGHSILAAVIIIISGGSCRAHAATDMYVLISQLYALLTTLQTPRRTGPNPGMPHLKL